MLLCAARFFTSFESSAWIVCGRWVGVGEHVREAADLPVITTVPFWFPGLSGVGPGTREFYPAAIALTKWELLPHPHKPEDKNGNN